MSHRNPWYTMKSGEKYFMNERAVCRLLDDGVLFVDSSEYFCSSDKEVQPETIVLFVNCNDVFAWACADEMEITTSELPALYDAHVANERWGSVMWAAKKSNLKPQWLMAKDMIVQGVWDEEMEALSDSYMWDCEEALNRKDEWAKCLD